LNEFSSVCCFVPARQSNVNKLINAIGPVKLEIKNESIELIDCNLPFINSFVAHSRERTRAIDSIQYLPSSPPPPLLPRPTSLT
jgi:hypothetical protein